MTKKSEIFESDKFDQPGLDLRQSTAGGRYQPPRKPHARDCAEIAIVFFLIIAAVWTPLGPLNSFFVIAAAASVIAIAVVAGWSTSQMGLTRPAAGALHILLTGVLLCGVIVLLGKSVRFAGNGYCVNWRQSSQYVLWSLIQEFILQSIFFLRFESLLGSRRAVFASSYLYALAHVPSPVLTALSLIGGIVFCELFRRYRNVYPLGLIHGALGLTIAASLPDRWMHHMRVGIGYLTMHR